MNVNNKKKVSVFGDEHAFHGQKLSSTVIDTKTILLTPEQIEAFFKATEDGSVERLEHLFGAHINADPNMTRFTESLLMAAIRTNRHEVAEYLIDQLVINVEHTTDLHEFRLRTHIPVRHRTFSCRDLAYDKGMMQLVDLIDITSDDVNPSTKRYLQRRLQSRLDVIHQAYLKRLKEGNKHSPFRSSKEEKENEEIIPTVDINDQTIIPSPLLPSIHRPYKSHIEETIQSIDSTNDKSIDETGKKTFRFSNYTLRFRLTDTTKESSKSKTTIPHLPMITRTTLPSPSSTSRYNNRLSISEASARLSFRDSHASICPSARRMTTPSSGYTDDKPATTSTKRRLLSKRVNQNNTNHKYIPPQQHAMYNQPRRFMPVTLKATAIGLPSDTRIVRD